MKLTVLALAAMVAATAASPITFMSVQKTLKKEADSAMCGLCKKGADAVVNGLLNYVAKAGVGGGCLAICSKAFPKSNLENEICDGVCMIAGESGLEVLLENLKLDPEALCYDIKLCKGNPPALSAAITRAVNADSKASWTASMDQSYFAGKTRSQLIKRLGVDMSKNDTAKQAWPVVSYGNVDVPAEFNSADQWPGCVGPILDQGECGSCWAFGAAESISDRMCIDARTRGNANATFTQLAALDLVECDSGMFEPNNGCQGGMPGSAFDYAKKKGLVTEKCAPYLKSQGGPIPTCAGSKTPEPCLSFVATPKCKKTCSSGASWSGDKHKLSKTYSVGGADDIAAEILQNGPVESAFTVYEDFVHYKSGVYKHTTGSALGGHAIKIVGFGSDPEPYWLVQNSWTTGWGDQGFFKIARGSDECGIEDGVSAGTF